MILTEYMKISKKHGSDYTPFVRGIVTITDDNIMMECGVDEATTSLDTFARDEASLSYKILLKSSLDLICRAVAVCIAIFIFLIGTGQI